MSTTQKMSISKKEITIHSNGHKDVVTFKVSDNGDISVKECCDYYFKQRLSHKDMMDLIRGLTGLLEESINNKS